MVAVVIGQHYEEYISVIMQKIENLLFGQRSDNTDIVDREVARLAIEAAVVPVLVDFCLQHDDVALLEAQLARRLGLEVVQGPAAGL